MNWLERGRKPDFPIFLEQERPLNRGVATCYPTSVVNAVLGFGLVTNEEAIKAHKEIIDALITVPELWLEENLSLSQDDGEIIVGILEQFLPVKVGIEFSYGYGDIFDYKYYHEIVADIINRTRTYVITDIEEKHSYATIPYGFRGNVAFVDPRTPQSTLMNFDNKSFNQYFHGSRYGRCPTTPLTPTPRRSYWYSKFIPIGLLY